MRDAPRHLAGGQGRPRGLRRGGRGEPGGVRADRRRRDRARSPSARRPAPWSASSPRAFPTGRRCWPSRATSRPSPSRSRRRRTAASPCATSRWSGSPTRSATTTDVVAYSLVQSRDGRVAAPTRSGRPPPRTAPAPSATSPRPPAGSRSTPARSTSPCARPTSGSPPRAGPRSSPSAPTVELRPAGAGWYAGQDVWASVYGPAMRLADDARRFDVSPAWLSWVGAAPVLEAFAAADLDEVHALRRRPGQRVPRRGRPGSRRTARSSGSPTTPSAPCAPASPSTAAGPRAAAAACGWRSTSGTTRTTWPAPSWPLS